MYLTNVSPNLVCTYFKPHSTYVPYYLEVTLKLHNNLASLH